MKNFKGKAIYNPSGKAGEYSQWACNFYVGCSNGCEYCYCKKGILAGAMGMDTPQLKKCFKSEEHALQLFESELSTNIVELQKHGLFFSFTTDPMLPETIYLTLMALLKSISYDVPVKILTKNAAFLDYNLFIKSGLTTFSHESKSLITFGFTLTGHDELEPNASTNQERIDAMKKLHDAGFKTFASIEPIIDFENSFKMMQQSRTFCDLYKIGLMSGEKYDPVQVKWFMSVVNDQFSASKIYFKDSLLKAVGTDRESLPSNCVTRDFNLHDAK